MKCLQNRRQHALVDEDSFRRSKLNDSFQFSKSKLFSVDHGCDKDSITHGHGDHEQPVPVLKKKKKRGNRSAPLLMAAFLYGTLNVSLRLVYALPHPPGPSALSATRGWMATICFIPFLRNSSVNSSKAMIKGNSAHWPLWKAALELAIWNFGAQGLLSVGLLSTTSARASFLTQTSVVMTPVISVLSGQKVNSSVWVGCSVAFAGLLLLSGGIGIGSVVPAVVMSSGDLLVLGGAICWSLYMFRMSRLGKAHDEVQLQASKTFLLALLDSSWLVVSTIRNKGTGRDDGGLMSLWVCTLLFYSALGPTTVADVLHQKGQSKMSPSEASVILSTEPIFSAICAAVLMGEIPSIQEGLGGGLILIAAVMASTM